MARVVELDPFAQIDRERVRALLKEEEERETYLFEKDNVAGLSEEDFDRLVHERYNRVEMEKDR